MIRITPTLTLDEREIQLDFVRSAGPGGQNVNKVSTAVQLRFDVDHSSLPQEVKDRLKHIAGHHLTDDGILILNARQHRTQDRNRQDAIQRLTDLIRRACERPKPRHKTRPTLASKMRLIETKKRRSDTKRQRRYVPGAE
jgi:ribosome-associated protein